MVRSSDLVPRNDPSLLFTNSGMVQFKDCFTGVEKKPYSRATSSQKCIRAGGKHNDLDNVGHTARHHTFFEMLGNFSFGDYFKEQAIFYAWQYLTQVLGIPPSKLSISTHHSDDESRELWRKIAGLPHSHMFTKVEPIIAKLTYQGDEDNFWSMGDGPGPCGTCTEIFYDQLKEIDGDRWLEIWNLVFMDRERLANGAFRPIPSPVALLLLFLTRIVC